jgi:hypothetical protein
MQTALILFASTMIITTCERRPLEYDVLPETAAIEVKIDWSKSGIDPASRDGQGVHRVSLRFFSKEKDSRLPVFDLYMEGNVTEGKISVPAGKYSVIVFNESVDDHAYWDGAITFTDINSFDRFAANAVPFDATERKKQFPFYSPVSGEQFIVEPLHLASWSIEHFEVTENMILVSQGIWPSYSLSKEESEMFDAFKNVVMRALTRPVNLTAKVENLISAQTNYFAMQGFASKVYMASGRTTNSPNTYLFLLGGRKYDSNGRNGTLSRSFRSFGRVPTANSESYQLAADILFFTGELYQPSKPLLFDVTGQVIPNYDKQVDIDLSISFSLPFVEGGISVDDWDDDVYVLE